MVELGDYYLPFFEESGSMLVRLAAVYRQPPRPPLRKMPFCFLNDPSETKEGG